MDEDTIETSFSSLEQTAHGQGGEGGERSLTFVAMTMAPPTRSGRALYVIGSSSSCTMQEIAIHPLLGVLTCI